MGAKINRGIVGIIASATLLTVSSVAWGLDERQIEGRASVIDGDTIEIHGKSIRLFGIDAPEASQICVDNASKKYRCGQVAAFALDEYLRGRVVTCEAVDRDRYGRMVARCSTPEIDLNAAIVHAGHAIAYRRYSHDYTGFEDAARIAGRGIWQGAFEDPGVYRRRAAGNASL